MSHWAMGSAAHPDGTRDVTIDFNNDDSNGSMSGTVVFEGATYYINGNWAASGSIPGRNYSAFAFWGSDQQAATVYIAAGGTMEGAGNSPQSITLNLVRASTANDEQYGWDGVLKPL